MPNASLAVQIDHVTGVEVGQKSTAFCAHVAINPIQVGVTNLAASSGNVANAVASATLAAAANNITYIAGFEITGAGATAALPVIVTVTGVTGGTLSYIYAATANPLAVNEPLVVNFDPPLPASALNTAIVVSCPALGVGNTNNTVNVRGFRAVL